MLNISQTLTPRKLAALWLTCAGVSALIVLQSDTRSQSRYLRESLAQWRSITPPQTPSQLAYRTLQSLDRAISSNDYTQLRAQAAAGFQRQNSARALATIFAPFRKAGLSLAPQSAQAIVWSSPPARDPSGRLRINGTFPAKPRSGWITFSMSFNETGKQWQLFSIATNYKPQADKPNPSRQARLQ
ncbi:MAG: hypothetical protein K0U74_09035 [Alphaproteobacteria bacterium]|nr:hypothetical protein [Alphaproteobacteria bacterium]